ncbi:hypothetical protein DSO57_1032194 [Entomophthora muscae]|uniref:Uncharacterized protein n=1 Tax=Entomophthora muscae TaxID=34485 RepID=A0ACC2RRD7_9FUNG|nr:hypothetical protein DSO57_1032194 [Entomophthora muscae]
MAKPKAKDKRQTQSQTTRQYKTSSKEEGVPDTWEERTDNKCKQLPTAMETDNTQQVTNDVMNEKRRKDASTSPDRRTTSACSSRPRGQSGSPRTKSRLPTQLSKPTREILEGKSILEEDITQWCELFFTVSAILRWQKAGFNPEEETKWEKEGFSSHAAIHWKEAKIPLEWATPMRNIGVQNMEALEWMKLAKHQAEVTQAVKAKLPLETAKEWNLHGFNLYEANKYFLAFVPVRYAKELKEIKIPADKLTIFFDLFSREGTAMEWAASRMTIDMAKKWRAMAFLPNKVVEWATQGFCPKTARRWAFIGINPTDARTLREARWNPDNVHLWARLKSGPPKPPQPGKQTAIPQQR